METYLKVVIAIDSMKGSLTSSEANQIVATVFKAADYEVEQVAIADGGEGTVEAYLTNQEGEWIEVETLDPLGEICKSFYGWYPEKKEAVIEVAASSGLGLIQNRKHNHPSQTSSFGTGQLILSAMDKGAKSIVIGLGGSGTIDGGIGILKALGVEFFDENGLELAGIGNDLAKIKRIDRNKMDQRLKTIEITVASDVSNPLTGSEGAVAIFGEQKGLRSSELASYDQAMTNFLKIATGNSISSLGDGAAGGMGFALRHFLNAKVIPGFTLIAAENELAAKIKIADLVITGEGQIDQQSLYGKVPVAIAKLAKKNNIPVIAFVGSIKGDMTEAYQAGISEIISIVQSVSTLENALKNASKNLEKSAKQTVKLLHLFN